MVVKLVVQTLLWWGAMGLMMFLAAGTPDWPGGWAFLVEVVGLSLVTGLALARHDPALLRERMGAPFQRSQPAADKLLLGVMILAYLAWLAFMPLDAVRFGWSFVPLWGRVLGALGLALSLWAVYRTFRENSFAAPVVKIQRERGQAVVTTGPYAWVRHPMYAGMLPYFVGVPLLLGSWWGVAWLPLFVALLAARIHIEERTLRAALQGYDAYAARVRYRLIPLVW